VNDTSPCNSTQVVFSMPSPHQRRNLLHIKYRAGLPAWDDCVHKFLDIRVRYERLEAGADAVESCTTRESSSNAKDGVEETCSTIEHFSGVVISRPFYTNVDKVIQELRRAASAFGGAGFRFVGSDKGDSSDIDGGVQEAQA